MSSDTDNEPRLYDPDRIANREKTKKRWIIFQVGLFVCLVITFIIIIATRKKPDEESKEPDEDEPKKEDESDKLPTWAVWLIGGVVAIIVLILGVLGFIYL